MVDIDEINKEYAIDKVAYDLLGDEVEWPDHLSTIKSVELTYKYSSLHKLAVHDLWPTAHLPTIARNFACLLFDIGTRVEVSLPQIVFQAIFDLHGGCKKTQRLIFPNMIYAIPQKQHPLRVSSEFIAPMLPLVNYRLKEKEVVEAVATPSSSKKKTSAKKSDAATTSATVATDSSSLPQTHISADLEALKKDQNKHNERLTAMEKVQHEILAKLTAVLSRPSVHTTAPAVLVLTILSTM
ncbi:hypothetical protein TorRG33x02_325640 [Trema orientale]|uniref:Uncharacterized protein n=1 Tax=Trema orientale TaxID=63057 RepID=A0A2P5BCM2_TREOI|nr:hypothetical protein TorRG33x02_325640 [Trema orientale]